MYVSTRGVSAEWSNLRQLLVSMWPHIFKNNSLTQAPPLQLSMEAVNARLVEKTRELNVVEIENEKLKVRLYIHTYIGFVHLCIVSVHTYIPMSYLICW